MKALSGRGNQAVSKLFCTVYKYDSASIVRALFLIKFCRLVGGFASLDVYDELVAHCPFYPIARFIVPRQLTSLGQSR